MKKTIELVLQEGNTIILSQEMMNELRLKEGNSISINYESVQLNKCCLTVDSTQSEHEQYRKVDSKGCEKIANSFSEYVRKELYKKERMKTLN